MAAKTKENKTKDNEKTKSTKTCFHCKKPIEDRYQIIPLDKPYGNLFFHKDCYRAECSQDERKYLMKNIEKIKVYLDFKD